MLNTIFQYLFPKHVMQGTMLSTIVDKKTGDLLTTTYSPYAEYEYTTPDQALLVRFVNTCGFERVPRKHPFTSMPKDTLRQWNNDGMIPSVGEIYFLNYSNEMITVKPDMLKFIEESMTFEEDIEIRPGVPYVTPPLVSVILNFSKELDVEFSFIYKDNTYDIKGTAQRLSMEEVNEKYSRW